MLSSISSFRPDFSGFQATDQNRGRGKSQAVESDVKNTESTTEPSTQQDTLELTTQQQRELETLKARDREVKTHEQAHLSASGGLARGGAAFTYQRGPDGIRYAVGGEVQIDTSAVPGDPAATLRKADMIRRAALAPAQPSAQDRSVAAQAAAMAAQARAELIQQEQSSSADADQSESEVTNGGIDVSI